MLNENIFHYFPMHATSFQPAAFTFYDPAEEDHRRRLHRAALLAEQERRRRYAAALEEQALLEELEKRRQQRLYEEEMERRRRQQEQQQQLLYEQAMILEEQERRKRRQQQQRLFYAQEMERRRKLAAALEEQRAIESYQKKLLQQKKKKEQKEEAERKNRLDAAGTTSGMMKNFLQVPTYVQEPVSTSHIPYYQQHQIVRGPDGKLYRIIYPTGAAPSDGNVLVQDNPLLGLFNHDVKQSKGNKMVQINSHHDDHELNSTDHEEEDIDATSTTTSSSDTDSTSSETDAGKVEIRRRMPAEEQDKKEKPAVFKNVTFNININHADDKSDSIENNKNNGNENNKDKAAAPEVRTFSSKKVLKSKSSLKNKKSKDKKCTPTSGAAKKKSSILIGDVEDASDSECEDEFGDYFHNRRPTTPGTWIEPVEGFGVKILRGV